MNLFILVWRYFWHRPWLSLLNIGVVALGTALMAVLLLARQGFGETLERQASTADLVIGAKGSPLQLVLSTIFYVDDPTGNIPLDEAERLSKSPLVAKAVPLALGDSYGGFKIVGSQPLLLSLYDSALTVAEGRLWEKEFEAVLGAEAAKLLQIGVAQPFFGEHGQGGDAHEEHAYTVVGVLPFTGTPLDRLILTDIPSVWASHGHEHHEADSLGKLGLPLGEGREITALLLKFNNPMGLMRFPLYVNQQTPMQAAIPSYEALRLTKLLGNIAAAAQALAGLVMLVACCSMGLSLYHAFKERRYDLGVLRAVGASQMKIFLLPLLEGSLTAMLGGLSGLILGTVAWASFSQQYAGLDASPDIILYIYLLSGVLAVGILASIVPAIQAYKTPVSDTLAGM